MTELQELLKVNKAVLKTNIEIVSQLKILNSIGSERIDAKTAISLLGRKNQREMKYIREHFETGHKMKNGCTYDYGKKEVLDLKQQIDSGKIIFPFGNNRKAAKRGGR